MTTFDSLYCIAVIGAICLAMILVGQPRIAGAIALAALLLLGTVFFLFR